MARHAMTMRLDDSAHRLIKDAAAACGVSQAQFMREASLIRALLVLEADKPASGTAELHRWRALSAEVRRLSGS